jgi:hypothetical protein
MRASDIGATRLEPLDRRGSPTPPRIVDTVPNDDSPTPSRIVDADPTREFDLRRGTDRDSLVLESALDPTSVLRLDDEDVLPTGIFDPVMDANGDLAPEFVDIDHRGRVCENCVG